MDTPHLKCVSTITGAWWAAAVKPLRGSTAVALRAVCAVASELPGVCAEDQGYDTNSPLNLFSQLAHDETPLVMEKFHD
jgi:hypothetical protein